MTEIEMIVWVYYRVFVFLFLTHRLIWYNKKMNQIWLALITLAVVITAGFLISLIIELRKTVRNISDLLKTTEESLKPTLEELQLTLKSLRNISDDINEVTTDIKTFSGSVKDVGMNVRHVSNLVEGLTSSTFIKVTGLKAGIKAGLMVLLSNLFTKKGGGQ
jgi:uncharacterized protein YoxC